MRAVLRWHAVALLALGGAAVLDARARAGELAPGVHVAPSVARRVGISGDRVLVRGRAAEVFDDHFFRVADRAGPPGLLVIVATPYAAPYRGETVVVRGIMRRFRPEALRRRYGWSGWVASPAARARRGEIALFASSVRDSRGYELVHEGPPSRPPEHRR
jgi:hypothetical protein